MILSSAGLNNIILDNNNTSNTFRFVFGEHEITLNNIYAEFISPIVSNLHHSDPTIDSIHFENNFNEDLFSEDILSLFKNISRGIPVKFNSEQGFKLQLISIIIDNEELLEKINQIHPFEINENNIKEYLHYLQLFHSFTQPSRYFNYSNIINFMSSNFYLLDKSELVKLPKKILYSIISNTNLKIETENSLFDFIQKVYSEDEDEDKYKEDEDNISIISFYENIEFSNLSKRKFQEFLFEFNSSEMTNSLWRKIGQSYHARSKENSSRYCHKPLKIEYNKNFENPFNGIIQSLTDEFGGNVDDKGIVKITASTVSDVDHPKYAADLEDKKHYFCSLNYANQWLKYDFTRFKIRPNYYSIRTRHDHGSGYSHLKNWVIEGSNTDNEDDWKILDERNEIDCLDNYSAMKSFKIQKTLDKNEYYRYLRLRCTGMNTGDNYLLILSALEYFGYLIEDS